MASSRPPNFFEDNFTCGVDSLTSTDPLSVLVRPIQEMLGVDNYEPKEKQGKTGVGRGRAKDTPNERRACSPLLCYISDEHFPKQKPRISKNVVQFVGNVDANTRESQLNILYHLNQIAKIFGEEVDFNAVPEGFMATSDGSPIEGAKLFFKSLITDPNQKAVYQQKCDDAGRGKSQTKGLKRAEAAMKAWNAQNPQQGFKLAEAPQQMVVQNQVEGQFACGMEKFSPEVHQHPFDVQIDELFK